MTQPRKRATVGEDGEDGEGGEGGEDGEDGEDVFFPSADEASMPIPNPNCPFPESRCGNRVARSSRAKAKRGCHRARCLNTPSTTRARGESPRAAKICAR